MSSLLQPRPLGNTGLEVSSLGLSATYFPGKATIHAALDEGINLFFAFGIDRQMTRTLRDVLPARRDNVVLVTGAYNYIWRSQDVVKACEKRLKQFNTEYIDIFLFLGVMKPSEFTPRVIDGLRRLKEQGKVRSIGLSCHHRGFLGKLAAEGTVDAMMLRYNAAHRGAEQDIFPHLGAHNPGVISYTATRWTYLLRRAKGMPENARVPTAGECYRFVLSHPNVHVALTAPKSARELRENIAAVARGPLSEPDMKFMRSFGDAVHHQKKWFM